MVSVITLSYEDLISFSSTYPNPKLMQQVSEAFGNSGLGIVAVSGIPEFEAVRTKLLNSANQLPDLDSLEDLVDEASMYSIGWSHGKEQIAGEPDYSKGSFYANPFDEDSNNKWPEELPELKSSLLEMSQILFTVGCRIAAVCDAYCRSKGVSTNLLGTLKQNKNAKGRLLHYFANPSSSWCAWHNDHGSLTGLVPGMYMKNGMVVECPDPQSGLYIQDRSNQQVKVSIPRGCCGFQIGETFQILSGNLLQATPHAVLSGSATDVTRQSFALFLQPTFETVLNLPADCSLDESAATAANLLPITKRWKPGQTFGEFHWATIRSYSLK